MKKIDNLYLMLKEFDYEKNGLDTTIDFLQYIVALLKEEQTKNDKDRDIKYTIDKNKVWKELFYKGVAMNSLCVFTGKTNKECQEWLKEHNI